VLEAHSRIEAIVVLLAWLHELKEQATSATAAAGAATAAAAAETVEAASEVDQLEGGSVSYGEASPVSDPLPPTPLRPLELEGYEWVDICVVSSCELLLDVGHLEPAIRLVLEGRAGQGLGMQGTVQFFADSATSNFSFTLSAPCSKKTGLTDI
jgi:hypothetical protein